MSTTGITMHPTGTMMNGDIIARVPPESGGRKRKWKKFSHHAENKELIGTQSGHNRDNIVPIVLFCCRIGTVLLNFNYKEKGH